MLLIFFVFGVCLGSFATVLINRLPLGEDFILSRSRCPKCHKKLSPYELIPIFSWIFLKRECKSCKSKISAIYIASEILIGFLAIFAYFIDSNLILALLLVIIFTIFYALSIIDLRLKAVPNGLLMSGYFLAIIYAFISDMSNIIDSFTIIGIMVILKSTLILLHNNKGKNIEPMGDGDSIFISSMVAILGLEWGFIALFIAALIQLVIHLIKKDRAIAFIPALFIGFIAILSIKNFTNINLGLI